MRLSPDMIDVSTTGAQQRHQRNQLPASTRNGSIPSSLTQNPDQTRYNNLDLHTHINFFQPPNKPNKEINLSGFAPQGARYHMQINKM